MRTDIYEEITDRLSEDHAEDLLGKNIRRITDYRSDKITIELEPESILNFSKLDYWKFTSVNYSREGSWCYLTARAKEV